LEGSQIRRPVSPGLSSIWAFCLCRSRLGNTTRYGQFSNYVLDRVLYQRAYDEEYRTYRSIKQPEARPDAFAQSLKNDSCSDRASWVSKAKIWLLGNDVLGNLVFNVEPDEEVERGD